MPDVSSEAAIKKHWYCAQFTPPVEDDTSHPLGVRGPIDSLLYDNVDDAKVRAKVLAAQSPGAYFVVYEAMWYAFTDITPVTLRRVGLA